MGTQFLAGAGVFLFTTASHPMGTGDSFPGGKTAGARSIPLTSI